MITVSDDLESITLRQLKQFMLEHDRQRGSNVEDTWSGMALYYWVVLRASGQSAGEAHKVIDNTSQTGEEREWEELTHRV